MDVVPLYFSLLTVKLKHPSAAVYFFKWKNKSICMSCETFEIHFVKSEPSLIDLYDMTV